MATSELKTAFQIGFLIFISFRDLDLVVASVLMSMGMMMLSPFSSRSHSISVVLGCVVAGMGTLAASFYSRRP